MATDGEKEESQGTIDIAKFKTFEFTLGVFLQMTLLIATVYIKATCRIIVRGHPLPHSYYRNSQIHLAQEQEPLQAVSHLHPKSQLAPFPSRDP